MATKEEVLKLLKEKPKFVGDFEYVCKNCGHSDSTGIRFHVVDADYDLVLECPICHSEDVHKHSFDRDI
jgi:hypothetical protein